MISVPHVISYTGFLILITKLQIEYKVDIKLKERKRMVTVESAEITMQIAYDLSTSTITEFSYDKNPSSSTKFTINRVYLHDLALRVYEAQAGYPTMQEIQNQLNRDVAPTRHPLTNKEKKIIYYELGKIKGSRRETNQDGWKIIEDFALNINMLNGTKLMSIDYTDGRISRIHFKYPHITKPHLLFLDGTHIYSSYKGVLLILLTVSPFKTLLPLSVMWCPQECEESTVAFIDSNIDIIGSNTTIISDQARCFVSVLKKRGINHCLCTFHILKHHQGKAKEIIKQMIYAETSERYMRLKQELSKNHKESYGRIEEYLHNIMLFDAAPPRYTYDASSPIESFNSLIKDHRDKNITSLFSGIINSINNLMERFVKMSMECFNIPGWLDKELKNRFNSDVVYISSIGSESGQAIVVEKKLLREDFYMVNMSTGDCTCMKSKSDGFPCVHQVKVFGLNRSMTMIDSMWKIENYNIKAIRPIIIPAAISLRESQECNMPLIKRIPGRPHKRFLSFSEKLEIKAERKRAVRDSASKSGITEMKIKESYSKLTEESVAISKKEGELYNQIIAIPDTDISSLKKIRSCVTRVESVTEELPLSELRMLKKRATLLKEEIKYYSKLKSTVNQPRVELDGTINLIDSIKKRIQTVINYKDDLNRFYGLLTSIEQSYKMRMLSSQGKNPYDALK